MNRPTSPVVPAIDLMIGQIVLATEGCRGDYQPVHSKLTHSSDPVEVAKSIYYQTGCDWLYLSDIDSFSGAEPNWAVYNDLIAAGFGLWIDADWLTGDWTKRLPDKIVQPQRVQIVISSETMQTFAQFDELEKMRHADLAPIFSLDKRGDTIITQPGELNNVGPLELVQQAYARGVRDLLVLDHQSVGTLHGVKSSESELITLIHEISQELAELNLISGGGICSAESAQQMLNAGCQHILISTAIHDCRFTPDEIAGLQPAKKLSDS